MNIHKIGSYTHTNEMAQSDVERWLNHGYALGATHAVLYFDRFDNCQAMSYVFSPDTLDTLLNRLKRDDHRIIQAWHYER